MLLALTAASRSGLRFFFPGLRLGRALVASKGEPIDLSLPGCSPELLGLSHCRRTDEIELYETAFRKSSAVDTSTESSSREEELARTDIR